jgi:hypothetical protein
VAIYLHLFFSMDPEGWKHLGHLLTTRPDLQLEATKSNAGSDSSSDPLSLQPQQ